MNFCIHVPICASRGWKQPFLPRSTAEAAANQSEADLQGFAKKRPTKDNGLRVEILQIPTVTFNCRSWEPVVFAEHTTIVLVKKVLQQENTA